MPSFSLRVLILVAIGAVGFPACRVAGQTALTQQDVIRPNNNQVRAN
jgi:hypothetical protein